MREQLNIQLMHQLCGGFQPSGNPLGPTDVAAEASQQLGCSTSPVPNAFGPANAAGSSEAACQELQA